jgi:hypothetical protein
VIAADHATNQSIPVTFSAGGADQDGNLPHLCSAVYTKIISNIAMNVICEIDSVCFKECLSDSADLPFSDDTIKNKIVLVVNRTDYTGSYSAPGDTITDSKNATINNTTVKDVKSDYGYLLPYPLRYPYKQYNVVNMNFHLKVNNTAVIFYAPGLQVPEFKAGYRYGFTIELDNGVIHLKLDVEPWSVLSWDSTMGGDPGDSFVQYTLGSWNTVSWQAGMGGGSGNTQAALTVGGWSGITWTSDMGK